HSKSAFLLRQRRFDFVSHSVSINRRLPQPPGPQCRLAAVTQKIAQMIERKRNERNATTFHRLTYDSSAVENTRNRSNRDPEFHMRHEGAPNPGSQSARSPACRWYSDCRGAG